MSRFRWSSGALGCRCLRITPCCEPCRTLCSSRSRELLQAIETVTVDHVARTTATAGLKWVIAHPEWGTAQEYLLELRRRRPGHASDVLAVLVEEDDRRLTLAALPVPLLIEVIHQARVLRARQWREQVAALPLTLFAGDDGEHLQAVATQYEVEHLQAVATQYEVETFLAAVRSHGTADAASKKLIYDWGKGRGPDGVKHDAKGRLYVAAGLNKPNPPFEPAGGVKGGIYVLSPEGKRLAFLPVPTDEVTNCAFGGDDLKTLYVTGGGTLYSIRTATPGRVLIAPVK
jgi:hypothetical protein